MTASKNKITDLEPNADEMEQLLKEHLDEDKPHGMPPFLYIYDYDTLKKMYIKGEDISQYVDHESIKNKEETQKQRDEYRAGVES